MISRWLEAPASDAAWRYARAARPASQLRWREAPYCVVDLETTGLDPRRDAIVAYGAVAIEGGRIGADSAIEGLVRPDRALGASSIVVHGIRPVEVAGAASLAVATDALLEAFTGRVLVAHAVGIERGFLRRALGARGVRLRGPVLDTATIGALWSARRNGVVAHAAPLERLAESLALPTHRPHDALGDALTTAQVFLALAAHLDAGEPQTVGSLARAGRVLGAMHAYRSWPSG